MEQSLVLAKLLGNTCCGIDEDDEIPHTTEIDSKMETPNYLVYLNNLHHYLALITSMSEYWLKPRNGEQQKFFKSRKGDFSW